MKIVKSIEVTAAIDEWMHYAAISTKPKQKPKNGWKEEWDKDHSAYFIGRVLPILYMPTKVRRIAVEAYLAGAEQDSNGSNVVPDSLRYGNTKDWQGVMHDYIFELHRRGWSDADGHTWTLAEANRAYRQAWAADGQALRGWAWWIGLTAGSWVIWNRKGQAARARDGISL